MFDFKSLVLNNVDITRSGGSSILKPGRYVCKVTDAEISEKGGNYQAVIQFKDKDSSGEIRAYLTLHHSNPKASEVGLKQLKQLAVYGGHTDPNNAPSHGIGSFKGLTVGVCVKEETYNDKTRAKVSYFFDPKEMKMESAEFGGSSSGFGDFADDVPFA